MSYYHSRRTRKATRLNNRRSNPAGPYYVMTDKSGVPVPVPSSEENTWIEINPRTNFHNMFQRKMEEHDQNFEKKYDGDLDITLIFSGLFSAVTSAFIIGIQSELTPDYEQMNNTLLEMLLNATTGSLPANSVTSIPRWSGPDPVVVQAQCILYAALSAALLASFLAMLGKQWINRYGRSDTRGSTADRSRARERKLNGVETWKLHLIMESLPLILQCALLLLGFALSRYLWGVNRSVSSVVIGFTSFGFLFYLSIVTVSILSFDCPLQTPFSLAIRFVTDLATPYWRNLLQTFGPKQQPPRPRTPGARRDLSFSVKTVGRDESEAGTITLPCIAPDPAQLPEPVAPLFIQEAGVEGNRLDARCITRMFIMSTDPNDTAWTMYFIPELVWHSGIKNVPLKRIYDILIDCFDFSGPNPVVIPGWRGVAYLSARAFAHIALQRRCITKYEEHKQDSWKALCANHPVLSPTDYGRDPDLETVLFMVDMTLGHGNGITWEQTEMTPVHHAWMSHVFLYHVWHEGKLSEVVIDFVERSMALEPLNDIVITDCLFIIGLMVGVPFHIKDITVRDKSRKKKSMIRKVFRALSAILSSKSIHTTSLTALWLVTLPTASDISVASCELFNMIMAFDDLTDQHWEAARLAAHGAFQENSEAPLEIGEPKGILKFLDYHLGLQGAGEDHMSSISSALAAIFVESDEGRVRRPTVECIREFNCTSPSFVRGVLSIMCPDTPFLPRRNTANLVALVSNQWFNSPIPIMEPEEMSKFCEQFAVFVDDIDSYSSDSRESIATIFFGMLRSPEWRKHIVAKLWSALPYYGAVEEEEESFRWCLRNAIELLEFMRGLPDGEGLKWWYVTLWFHYDKLDATVRDEAERMARDISRSDGLPGPNSYLDLIEREVKEMRRELDSRWSGSDVRSGESEVSPRVIVVPASETPTETPLRRHRSLNFPLRY